MQNPLEVLAYQTTDWQKPFWEWYEKLDLSAIDKVSRVLVRMERGNLSNVKPVGEGVLENRINFGPGYRIYFGRDGDRLIILLAGGTKKHQQQDIVTAKIRWRDYKNRRQPTGGTHDTSGSTSRTH